LDEQTDLTLVLGAKAIAKVRPVEATESDLLERTTLHKWDLLMYVVPFAAAIILIKAFDIAASKPWNGFDTEIENEVVRDGFTASITPSSENTSGFVALEEDLFDVRGRCGVADSSSHHGPNPIQQETNL
jgi:hypothetical protein